MQNEDTNSEGQGQGGSGADGETAPSDAHATLAAAFQAFHYDPQVQSLIADVMDALHGDE